MAALAAARAVFVACALWMAGLGLYFIFLRPALLPEDLRYFAATAQQLASAAPRLLLAPALAWAIGVVLLIEGRRGA